MVDKKQQNSLAGRVLSMLNGRSTISSHDSASSVMSPKSSAPRLGLSILSSPTIDLPGLPSHGPPSSRMPVSPYAVGGVQSPDRDIIVGQPSATPRQSAVSVLPPSQALIRPGQSSPRRNLDREYVRGGSENIRRRRKRAKIARPRTAAKSIFRAKAGRMKLIRCLASGSLLAIGLTVCGSDAAFAKMNAYNLLQTWLWRSRTSSRASRCTSL